MGQAGWDFESCNFNMQLTGYMSTMMLNVFNRVGIYSLHVVGTYHLENILVSWNIAKERWTNLFVWVFD